MSNDLYDGAANALWTGEVDYVADDLRAILIKTSAYTVDLINHTHLDDVAMAARIAVSGTITGRSVATRALDANDVVFAAPSGDPAQAVIIYKHTGTDSTSRLLIYWDTSVPGLPVTPDGISDIEIPWAAAGICDLFAV